MYLSGVADYGFHFIMDLNYSLLCHSITPLWWVEGSLPLTLGLNIWLSWWVSGSDARRTTRLEMALPCRACFLVIQLLSWEEHFLGCCSLSAKPQDESQGADLNMIGVLGPSQAEPRQDQLNLNQPSDLSMRKVNICVLTLEIFWGHLLPSNRWLLQVGKLKKDIFPWCSNYLLSENCQ